MKEDFGAMCVAFLIMGSIIGLAVVIVNCFTGFFAIDTGPVALSSFATGFLVAAILAGLSILGLADRL